MDDEFKTGDVVWLKSGGPALTVQAAPGDTSPRVMCSWFNGCLRRIEPFIKATLTKENPNPIPESRPS